MDPVTASAAIAGVVSLFSSIFGAKSQSSTNKMNYLINRENQIFSDQQATLSYNRQRTLIREQNEYNSYANQRKLMEEGGFNPYNLVGSAGGTAVSSSSTQAPQASQPSPIAMQAYKLDLAAAFASIQNSLSDAALKQAQARNIEAGTPYVAPEALSRIGLNNEQAKAVQKDAEMQALNIKLFDDTYNDRKLSYWLQNELTAEQAACYKAQMQSTVDHLQLDKAMQKYMIEEYYPAQIAKFKAEMHCSDSQAAAAISNAAYYYSLKEGVEIENNFKGDLYSKEFLVTELDESNGTSYGNKTKVRYSDALFRKAVSDFLYSRNRGVNELKGLPYIITTSQSSGGNISLPFGIGFGTNSSSSKVYNPIGN